MYADAGESKTVAFSGPTESCQSLAISFISFLAFKGGWCVDKGSPDEVVAL